MRFYIKTILTASFLLVISSVFFFSVPKSFAQYCSGGTYWCGNWNEICVYPGSSLPCDPNQALCDCSPSQCVDSYNGSCSSEPNSGACANPCAGAPCTVQGCIWNPGTSGGGGGGGGNPTPAPTSPPTCNRIVDSTYTQCGCNAGGSSVPTTSVATVTKYHTTCDSTPQYECSSSQDCSPGTCSGGSCVCNKTVIETYSECGQQCGSTSYPANQVLDVQKMQDCNGKISYQCSVSQTCSNGCSGGSCVAATPTPTPTQAPSGATCNQAYGTCGCSANCKDGTNTDYSCCHRVWGSCSSGNQSCITVYGSGAQQCANNTSQTCGGGSTPTPTQAPPQNTPTPTPSNPNCSPGQTTYFSCTTTKGSCASASGCIAHNYRCSDGSSVGSACNTACGGCASSGGSGDGGGLQGTAGGGGCGIYGCGSGGGSAPTPVPRGWINGHVFEDKNGNNSYDWGEGVGGVNVKFDWGGSNPTSNSVKTQSQLFGFLPVQGGLYNTADPSKTDYTVVITVTPPSGYYVVSTNPVFINDPDLYTATITIDFQIAPGIPTASPTPTSVPVTLNGTVYASSDGACSSATAYAGGAHLTIVDSGGNTVASTDASATGNYSLNIPSGNNYYMAFSNMSGYSLKNAKVGAAACGPVTAGQTYGPFNVNSNQTLNFYFGNSASWFQTESGDVRMNAIVNKVPLGQKASVSTTAPSLFYSTTANANFGSDLNTQNLHVVNNEYAANSNSQARNGSAAYTYYEYKAKQENKTITPVSGSLPTSSGIYNLVDGYNIQSAYHISSGSQVTLLGDGDLTISAPITVDQGGLLIIAAKGDITIDKSVGQASAQSASTASPNIEGIISSEKNITIAGDDCSDGTTPDKQLIVQGVLIANAVKPFASDGVGRVINQRSLCAQDATYPSLYVGARLDFLTQLTDFYKTTYQKWVEVQP